MGLRRFEYSAEGRVSPGRFIKALTTFDDNRPRYFPGNTPSQYRVIEKGPTSALIREGTGTVWEQSRYDWSLPGLVVSTVEESNFLRPGTTWEFRVSKISQGCRVDAVLTRDFAGVRGGVVQALTYIPPGAAAVFTRALRRTLGTLEREEADRPE